MTTEEKAEWFERSLKFVLDGKVQLVMKSRKNGEGSWSIVDTSTSQVLNSNLEWESEPQLSKRDQSFLIRARFPFDQAAALFEQYKMFAGVE
ncbi:MAG: hypothetical protein IPM56_16765 [Ignavibacteriales bacterium]|nr:MAG: hypothetical protein IPM56_16765 [Ignavibacteriales bacterium]